MPYLLSAFADEAGPTAAEQIAALHQAGITRIDIRNIDGHNITALPLDHAKKIRDELVATKITVAMYGSPIGKIDITDDFTIDLEKLKYLGKLRPILGASAVRIFSYYNKSEKPKPDFQKESLSRLKQLKSLAADLGLTLYHENEAKIFGDKADDVLTIATALRDSSPTGTFKMIFDFGNYNFAHEDVYQNWQLLASTTDAFHFKDSIQSPDGKFQHVPVGQGAGQIDKILADSVQKKIPTGNIPVTVEPHLQHSAAVLATAPGGIPNQSYAKMTANESFQIACKAAKEVLTRAGAI